MQGRGSALRNKDSFQELTLQQNTAHQFRDLNPHLEEDTLVLVPRPSLPQAGEQKKIINSAEASREKQPFLQGWSTAPGSAPSPSSQPGSSLAPPPALETGKSPRNDPQEEG